MGLFQWPRKGARLKKLIDAGQFVAREQPASIARKELPERIKLMQAAGAPPELIEREVQKTRNNHRFHVMHENWLAWQIFSNLVESDWSRTQKGALLSIKTPSLRALFEIFSVRSMQTTLRKIRLIESGFITELSNNQR